MILTLFCMTLGLVILCKRVCNLSFDLIVHCVCTLRHRLTIMISSLTLQVGEPGIESSVG